MENINTFYQIKKIDNDCTSKSGTPIKAGYYSITYSLDGKSPFVCRYSKNRCEWEECGLFTNLAEFLELFNEINDGITHFERMEYLETITYRGMSVPVFIDDYGQCFFYIIDNEIICCGGWECNYEIEIRSMIDKRLDEKQ